MLDFTKMLRWTLVTTLLMLSSTAAQNPGKISVKELNNFTATILGHTVTLQVKLNREMGQGLWFHNNSVRANTSRSRYSESGLIHQLTITDTQYSDAGRYYYAMDGFFKQGYLTMYREVTTMTYSIESTHVVSCITCTGCDDVFLVSKCDEQSRILDCPALYTVCVLVDGSNKTNVSDFFNIVNTLKSFVVESVTRNNGVRIGIVVYGSEREFKIPASSNISFLIQQIDSIVYPIGFNDSFTGLGINSGREILLADPSSNPRVMIIITEDVSRRRKLTIEAASQAKQSGITLFSVGIEQTVRLTPSVYAQFLFELQEVASSRDLLFNISSYDRLEKTMSDIYQRLCRSEDCLAQIDDRAGQGFLLQPTPVDNTFYTEDICGVDKRPFGVFRCLTDGQGTAQWGPFILNPACNFSDLNESSISDTLRNLSLVNMKNTNTAEVLLSTIDIIKDKTLTLLDLLYISDILEKTNNLQEISHQIADYVVQIYNIVLNSKKTVLIQAQKRGRVANRILEVMDSITDKLSLGNVGFDSIHSDTFGTEVWDLTKQNMVNLPIGLQLREHQQLLANSSLSLFETSNVNVSKTDTAIVLYPEWLKEIVSGSTDQNVRLSMNLYYDPRLFSVSENTTHPTNYRLNSKVISAKILSDGQTLTNLNGTNVTLVFMPNMVQSEKEIAKLTVCGYWNFTGNDLTGSWSTDGCSYVGVEDGRDMCVCEHLTNFAVLFDYYGQNALEPAHALSLSIITIIGLSLSIFGLTVTVLSFIIFRKLRKGIPQKTLFNLALAELCAWIVFLAGINQAQSYVGCIMVAALLHYFILASFMWMLAEAVLHYRLFVKVFGTYTSKYMLKTGVPAWVIPLVPVIVVLAIDTSLYKGGQSYCWMSLTAFYYAFALPVGLIILCNVILYILVVVNICRRSELKIQSSQSKKSRTALNIRVSVLCFLLLGLSWIFGFLAISDARVVFQYLFCISNSIQGFLIFLFFTARNKQVRESWTAVCCKKREKSTQGSKPKSSDIQLNKNKSELMVTNSSGSGSQQTGFTNLANEDTHSVA